MAIPFNEILEKGEYAYKKPETRLMSYARYVSGWADKCKNKHNEYILRVLSAGAYFDAGHSGIARAELERIEQPLKLPVDMLYKYNKLARKIDPQWEEIMRFYSAIRFMAMLSDKPYLKESN